MTLNEHSGSFSAVAKGSKTDKRRQWTFIMNDDGTWGWHVTKPDGSESSSKRSFKKLTDCTADAVSHGYVVWEHEERRSSERTWKDVRKGAR